MVPQLLGLAVLLIVGFILTVFGNPSYWQIIGLVLMMVPVGGAAMLQIKMSQK